MTLAGDERERFWRANEALKTKRPALHMEKRAATSWLRPDLRVIVKHLAGEHPLRHATVQRIASLPEPLGARPAPSRTRSASGGNGASKEPAHMAEPGAVPDRDALLRYYRAVAPLMLPHLAGRPLNLLRCHGRYCFFQRNRSHPETGETF